MSLSATIETLQEFADSYARRAERGNLWLIDAVVANDQARIDELIGEIEADRARVRRFNQLADEAREELAELEDLLYV